MEQVRRLGEGGGGGLGCCDVMEGGVQTGDWLGEGPVEEEGEGGRGRERERERDGLLIAKEVHMQTVFQCVFVAMATD